MFKKFAQSDITGKTNVKSSAQRAIRDTLIRDLKVDTEKLEQIWPKKEVLVHVKCRDHISIYTVNGDPLFFQQHEEQLYPTLWLVQKYPSILPRLQVDRGAIRFLLAGANMMCRGFTSPGGELPPTDQAIEASKPVAIFCEGKEHPAAIGFTKLSTEEIKSVNKDVGVELKMYLGDDLWKMQRIGK
ncbi:uncharacterized protein FOMMEDRAFT_166285 [Fomitiporia mediterranea MF3/22]|uniref:uncharacterized protein n=1 Tax=Fomitiporia mediterranea (strain MF3/22) TaxID=694068 RepID=UPI0004408C65|nr:uncharacterized protein FOMMEDRAFT_166285 [Fomitiporia mediterranea MF3/22]EJD05989.1 hypothetical protein FOMMEDRAFT_166285 [Fomitiporia mediterranea MF3/22]